MNSYDLMKENIKKHSTAKKSPLSGLIKPLNFLDAYLGRLLHIRDPKSLPAHPKQMFTSLVMQ